MLTLLSKSTRARKYVSQVIGLEPCIVTDQVIARNDIEYNFLESSMLAVGIHSLYGPKFSKQTDLMCNFAGENSQVCDFMRYFVDITASDDDWFG